MNSQTRISQNIIFFIDKFYFAILISLILLLLENGLSGMWALDIGITYLVMGIVYFIVRKLGKVDMTKVMKNYNYLSLVFIYKDG